MHATTNVNSTMRGACVVLLSSMIFKQAIGLLVGRKYKADRLAGDLNTTHVKSY